MRTVALETVLEGYGISIAEVSAGVGGGELS
jgi:hypothetical protein